MIDAGPEGFDGPLFEIERCVTQYVCDAAATKPVELSGSGRGVVRERERHSGFRRIVLGGSDAEIFRSGGQAAERGKVGTAREE